MKSIKSLSTMHAAAAILILLAAHINNVQVADGAPNCDVQALMPCKTALFSPGTKADSKCCIALTQQLVDSCYCKYNNNPIIKPYINRANEILVDCKRSVPKTC
ncbi:probable non-specific lipid-transfer protein AKCS9 [Andrographis paniculata]|uniref:probable non-specific lipid-transfer protein AKCS9 n=1 Tax=Andrographis paniculata TaxID=175694 RepID=UPI0021E7717A|nr:probable non-specific lipid-transfer protein AKCS9 [Andrographis paniculata]